MKQIVSAIRSGLSERALALLKLNDSDLSIKQAHNLLTISLKSDEGMIVEWLVNESIYRFDFDIDTLVNLLKKACELGSKRIVRVLLSLESISRRLPCEFLFNWARKGGNLEVFNILLADSRVPYIDDHSIGHTSFKGTSENFKQLLQNAKITSKVKNDMLHTACSREDIVAVKNLLDNRRTYEIRNNNNVLQVAVSRCNLEIVKILLSDKGIDPSIDYCYPAQIAVRDNLVEIVKIFLTDSRITPKFWIGTGLPTAIVNGHKEIVKLLINLSIAEFSVYGEIALQLAIENNRVEIVKMLLKKGIDIVLIKSNPIMIAVESDMLECLDIFLKDSRSELSPKIHKALIAAISRNNILMVQKLLEDERIDPFLLKNEIISCRTPVNYDHRYGYYSVRNKYKYNSDFSEISNMMLKIGCRILCINGNVIISQVINHE